MSTQSIVCYLRCFIGLFLFVLPTSTQAISSTFDHSHALLEQVLNSHVAVFDEQRKSAVDYQAIAKQPKRLDDYLAQLSSVTPTQYASWDSDQQLAFLINAYNAFTIKLITDNMQAFNRGEAQSIRDLGSFFTSPWEQSFFKLLGKQRSLDWLEHEKIRVDFNEPRIHFALVCAAVSCPKLRSEAYQASQLNEQLENQTRLFLSDRDKNGIDEAGIYLSKIFKWYGDDFNGIHTFLRHYSDALTDSASDAKSLTHSKLPIRYTDYNWALNTTGVN